MESSQHAKMFALAYDLLHSHKILEKAEKTMPKLFAVRNQVKSSDRNKIDALMAQITESVKNKKEQ